MRTRDFGTILLVALTLLAATPARAQNEVALRVTNGFYPSPSLDLFASDDLVLGAELGYSRELLRIWRGSLWAEGSYLVSSSKAESFSGQLQSKALFNTLNLGVLYRLPLWRWLVPHARFGLGVLIGTLSLDPSGTDKVSDTSAALSGQFLVGAELLWPRALRRGFNFGLVIEGGYSFSSPLGFSVEPEQPEDLRTIPVSGADLGSVVLHGGQFRVGAVFRF
jgi:hypothetical protein